MIGAGYREEMGFGEPMMPRNLITEWTHIDKADDPTSFIRRMDLARFGRESDPAMYQIVGELLDVAEGQKILDVGCGTGGAVGAVQVFARRVGGTGKVVGVDISKTMVDEALRRTHGLSLSMEFRQGNAHRLPFPDNSFDRCYALRLMEVIGDPVSVLCEMHRVLKPGGRIYINGPDVDMWTFDASDRFVTRKIIHCFCDHEVNGWIGRQMPRCFAETGLADINVSPSTVFVDYTTASDLYLSEILDRAQLAGIISRNEAGLWLGDLQANSRLGNSPCSQTFPRVVGRKPR
jgi:ubiquinone/menaquinone biosynthesis C-methylase UbiE